MPHGTARRFDRLAQLAFLSLALLLVGYMFLGRGFAHIGIGPVFIGEVGLIVVIAALVLCRVPLRPHWLHVPLLASMAWGLARTLPYVPEYGLDALRDAVLWGYGLFALALSILVDRRVLAWAVSGYRRLLPVFVLWVPVAAWIFGMYQDMLPRAPGSTLPLLYFKNQDMAVHLSGALAFLLVGAFGEFRTRFLPELLINLPLVYGAVVTSPSRGALAALASAAGALLVLRPFTSHWLPVLGAASLVTILLVSQARPAGPSATPTPTIAPTLTPAPTPGATPAPTPGATPAPTPGREVSINQIVQNIGSIFGSSDPGLEGTRSFRLRWWMTIIDYTILGPYFWTGKGYGINLANADGFQVTMDDSLRAPHNSHLSVLARSGVPGLVLWLLLLGSFGVALLRAMVQAGRAGDRLLQATAAWIVVYWLAMLVNTSFDPYLEGPQGGIWFWTLMGLGIVVIREASRGIRVSPGVAPEESLGTSA